MSPGRLTLMKILIGLTYYRPHVSGVTVYAQRLARGLAEKGHEVTVLTSPSRRSFSRRRSDRSGSDRSSTSDDQGE